MPTQRNANWHTNVFRSDNEVVEADGELWGFYAEVFTRPLQDAGADPERLAPPIENLPTLHPDSRGVLFERLEEVRSELDNEARSRLWMVMRAEAAKNREYADAASRAEDRMFGALSV